MGAGHRKQGLRLIPLCGHGQKLFLASFGVRHKKPGKSNELRVPFRPSHHHKKQTGEG